jgi:hypothetical protein
MRGTWTGFNALMFIMKRGYKSMKKFHLLVYILCSFALLLVGCANSISDQPSQGDKTGPEPAITEESSAAAEGEPGNTPITEIPEDKPVTGEVPPEILEAITADLIKQTGAARQDIRVVRSEAVVWNDGSLGCPQPGEVYIQILVAGYWVVVQVEGVEYDYRVSDSNHFKLCEEESMPPDDTLYTGEPDQNPLVLLAREDLAERLNVPMEEIKLLSFDEVVWPDASLGCSQPGMVYAQVPQDGSLIRLGVGREMYFYHSGGDRAPFLCEGTSQIIPEFTPINDELIPPPGSEID